MTVIVCLCHVVYDIMLCIITLSVIVFVCEHAHLTITVALTLMTLIVCIAEISMKTMDNPDALIVQNDSINIQL